MLLVRLNEFLEGLCPLGNHRVNCYNPKVHYFAKHDTAEKTIADDFGLACWVDNNTHQLGANSIKHAAIFDCHSGGEPG